MLLSASPDAEALITGDLGKSLSNQLDRSVLYGTGGTQPMGIASHADTIKVPYDAAWWQQLTELECQCLLADIASVNLRRNYLTTYCPGIEADGVWQAVQVN
jgi:hypothetical protein